MGEPFVSRRVLSLTQPEVSYSKRDLAAVIERSLSGTSPPRNFLLLASPGSGSSTLVRELENVLSSLAESLPNFVHLHSSPVANSRFPYSVRSIAGEYLKKPLLYLDALWRSLSFRQKITYLAIYGLSLLALNYATLWGTAWGAGEVFSWRLISLKSLAAFGLITAIGAVLPAAVLTYWKSLWKNLSEEDLDRGNELMSILRRNRYRALVSIFKKRFLKVYGPIFLAIDSIDDLDDSFDKSFIFDHLLPLLTKNHRLVVFGISKLPTEARLAFQEKIPNLHIFMLEPAGISGFQSTASFDVASSPEPREEPRARELRQVIARIAESYPEDEVSAWTLLCILAASPHFERQGFTLKRLSDIFQARIALLNKMLASDGRLDATTTSQIQEILRQILLGDMMRNLFIFNNIERKYFWDHAARQQVLGNAPVKWRLIGRAFWLSSHFDEVQQPHAAWTRFDAVQVAKRLVAEIPQVTGQEAILSEIALIAADIVNQTSRTAYADLRESCGILYFVARSFSTLSQDVTVEDAACLSALVIYGRTRGEDLAALAELISKAGSASPLLTFAIRTLTIGDAAPDPEELSLASLPEGDLKALARWLHGSFLRRTSVLPMLLVEKADVDWEPYVRTLPHVVGGFNLATLGALTVATDANQLNQRDLFLQAWTLLAHGALKLGQMAPTSWEHVWIEYLSTHLTVEMVIFLAGSDCQPIYDHEGLRHDLGLQSLAAEQMQAFAQVSTLVGVEIPKDPASVLPVSVLRSLNEAIEDIRVKLLLLSLRDMANLLVCLRARLVFHTANLEHVQKSVREDLVAELHRVSNLSPPLARTTYRAEALMALYRIDSAIHKSLGAESLVYLLKEFEFSCCPQHLVDLVYDRYINELRFSHSMECLKLAARLLLRRLRNPGALDQLRIARLYCKLALDLLRLERQRGAQESWHRAKRALDNFTKPLRDRELLKLFRDTELLLYIERVRIFDELGDGASKVERFLRDRNYTEEPGHSYLQLLWLASQELPIVKLGLLADAIERVELDDWYAGYIWALLLRRLLNRMAIDQRCGPVVERMIPLLIAKIGRSDMSGINLEEAIDDFRKILGSPLILGSVHEILEIYESLQTRKATVSFGEALTLWMEGGMLGEVAFSYYRLVQPYVEHWLPGDVRAWSLEEDYPSFRENGWRLLSRYAEADQDTSWLAIYIAGLLERKGKAQGDSQLETRLQGIWVQLGVSCIESLLRATIGSAALPASLRIVLRSQMESFARNRKLSAED